MLGPPAIPLLDAVPVAVDGRHNAFPHALRLPDGALLATWRRSSGHLRPDGAVEVARSRDDGRTWERLASLPGAPDLRDPCLTLLADGRLLLSAFAFDGERSTGVEVRTSSDAGATFGPPTELPQAWPGWTAVSAPVVELDGGDLVLPVYGRALGQRPGTLLMASTDGGTSWGVRSVLVDGQAHDDDQLEPWVMARDQALVCLLRSSTTVVRRVESADGGRTWSEPQALFRSHSRVSAALLPDGRAVAVYRSIRDRSVVARWSTDDFRTWGQELAVHGGGLGTYAGVVPATEGVGALAVFALETRDRLQGHVLARVVRPDDPPAQAVPT